MSSAPGNGAAAPRFKGAPVVLGGQTYVLPPLSLGALEDHEQDFDTFPGLPFKQQLRLVVDIALRALQRNYPEMTRNELRELIDTENALDVYMLMLQGSGLVAKPDGDEGNARATPGAGQPSTPTLPPASAGPSSTAASA